MESAISINIFFVFLQPKDVGAYKNPHRHHTHQCNYSDSLHILHGVWPEVCPKLLEHITHHTSKKEKSVQTALATFSISAWEAGQWTQFPTAPKGLLWKPLLKNKGKHWMWRNSQGKLGWISAFWCKESSDSYLFSEIQEIILENLIFLWHSSLVVDFFT